MHVCIHTYIHTYLPLRQVIKERRLLLRIQPNSFPISQHIRRNRRRRLIRLAPIVVAYARCHARIGHERRRLLQVLQQHIFAVLDRDIAHFLKGLYLLLRTCHILTFLTLPPPRRALAVEVILRGEMDRVGSLGVSEHAISVKVGAIRVLQRT